MKDIVITSRRISIELYWLLACTIGAFIFNIVSIIKFSTPWSELITSLHIVLLLSLVFYILVLFIRGLVGLVIRLATGRRKD